MMCKQFNFKIVHYFCGFSPLVFTDSTKCDGELLGRDVKLFTSDSQSFGMNCLFISDSVCFIQRINGDYNVLFTVGGYEPDPVEWEHFFEEEATESNTNGKGRK